MAKEHELDQQNRTPKAERNLPKFQGLNGGIVVNSYENEYGLVHYVYLRQGKNLYTLKVYSAQIPALISLLRGALSNDNKWDKV